ncbi:hypothetical protein [Streptomyces sp. NPDC047028]|uniref:hypothetical protein n=1 Tax=Streptomyces sp. NPDC047028 TaxID=3155793 RepID=UPI003404F58D
MRNPRGAGRASAAFGLVGALALFAGACAGGPAQDGTGRKASADADDKKLEQVRCLRANGLDVPDPQPGQEQQGIPLTGDRAAIEKALKACRGTAGAGGGAITQADKDKALKFARCMRKNGLDFPDPDFGGGSVKLPAAPQGAEKEKWDKAEQSCESVVR